MKNCSVRPTDQRISDFCFTRPSTSFYVEQCIFCSLLVIDLKVSVSHFSCKLDSASPAIFVLHRRYACLWPWYFRRSKKVGNASVSAGQAWLNQAVYLYCTTTLVPPGAGGYFQKSWVGVCGPLPKTLTLFMTKICDFCHSIYDLAKISIPSMTDLWPQWLAQLP